MRTVLFWIIIFLTQFGTAQQALPNPDFEEWDEEGGIFTGYLDPAGWETVNSSTNLLGLLTAERAEGTDAFSGSYAMRLESKFLGIANQVIPGICATGDINIDTENVESGVPINSRPHAITGWYRYFPSGVDTGQVGMILTRWNSMSGVRDTVGVGGFFALGTTENYTFFSGPVEYQSELTPDTMIVVLVSSSQFEPKDGSTMFVDNLFLEYLPTQIIAESIEEVPVFPNPVNDKINFEVEGARLLEVFDRNGRLAELIELDQGQQSVDVLNLSAGQYLLRFLGNNSELLSRARVAVTR